MCVQERAQPQEMDEPERASQLTEKEEEEEKVEKEEESVSPTSQGRMETTSATAVPTATPPEVVSLKV